MLFQKTLLTEKAELASFTYEHYLFFPAVLTKIGQIFQTNIFKFFLTRFVFSESILNHKDGHDFLRSHITVAFLYHESITVQLLLLFGLFLFVNLF